VPPEPGSPDGKQALDQEHDALVDAAIDEDAPKAVEHGVDGPGTRLAQGGAALRDYRHRHLHAVCRGVVGQQHLEELQRQQLVRHTP
jgi:hypothetical protein